MTEPLADHKALLDIVAGLVPATAQQVAAALGGLSTRLGKLTDELAAADQRATQLTEDYGTAYDKAYLMAGEGRTKVTEGVRAATARISTAELRLQMELAKMDVRNLRAAHKTLDRRIDVGRTTAATVRSEHRTIGYGQAS